MQAEVFHLVALNPAEIEQCLWHSGSLQVLPSLGRNIILGAQLL